MGRYAGWIALYAGVAGGADVILMPEIPFDLDIVAERLKERETFGATRIEELSYMDFIAAELRVMDTTAVTMCKEHGVPIVVFDMITPGNIVKAVSGEKIGTVIH